MELRKDVKYMLESDWEPKVPGQEVVLKQAKAQLKKGKSFGSVALDIKAMRVGNGALDVPHNQKVCNILGTLLFPRIKDATKIEMSLLLRIG